MKTVTYIFFSSLLVYVLVSLQIQIPEFLYNTDVHGFLVSDELHGFLLNFSLSLTAACVFYVFMNIVPERKRIKNSEMVLRKVASIVLHAYKESKIFGHEMSAKHVPDELVRNWMLEQIKFLREEHSILQKQTLFFKLKCAVDAAYSQKGETSVMMAIAASASEKHALEWLNVLSKLRLLAEEYGRHLSAEVYSSYYDDGENVCFEERQGQQSISYLRLCNLKYRMLEYLEACIDWYDLTSRSSKNIQ